MARKYMGNNLEEYSDALVYEAEYGQYIGDFDFFLSLKAQGDVLDLACGTGRLTIPFAKKGFNVTGLDASKTMLDLARQKSEGLSIKWIQGDIREFDLNQTFDLVVMTGNSFQALLTTGDQLSMLACAKKHLKLGGVFAFNTRNPSEEDLKTTDEFEWWHDFQDGNDEPVHVYGKQDYNPGMQTVIFTTKRVWPSHETIRTIQLRFTAYDELMHLLEQAGFLVTDVYGDFEKGPFTNTSLSIMPTCRLITPSDSEKLR
jgi:SAM-dependent methyltransferase